MQIKIKKILSASKNPILIYKFDVLKSLGKHISLLILLCLGLFLVPNQSYACTKKSTTAEQSSCSKETSKKTEHKDSCKKSNHDNGCEGSCKHSSCRCGASISSLVVPIDTELNTKNQFAEVKKQKFGYKQAYYPSGFFSIWLPPKIS